MTRVGAAVARPAVVGAAVALAGALLWLRHPPPVEDLAAQTAWAQLVARSGYVPWFARWYGGVPVGGYSLTTPALMATLGVRTVGVVATVATGALAGLLLGRGNARRPVLGSAAFGVAAVADLTSGRLTFAAGGALALAAVLAAERGSRLGVVAAAALATVTSPVAGLFLLVPAGAYLLRDAPRRRAGLWLAGTVVAVGAAQSAVFPVGGREPFAAFVLRPALEIVLVAALLPVGRRVRAGLLLAAALTLAAYLLTSPVGSNVTRLAILVAIPTVLASARLPLGLLAPTAVVLGLWPWHQLHDDLVVGRSSAARAAYTAPLTARLLTEPGYASRRVEVVEPRTHAPTTILVAHGITPARGWERQVDEGRNPLFYDRAPLTAATYRQWLDAQAVSWVALPRDAGVLDFGSAAEAALVRGGLPYLDPVWSNRDWTLYAVGDPTPVSSPGAVVTALTDTGADLTCTGPTSVVLALRWSPWLVVDGGTVHRDGDRVRLDLTTAGPHRLHAVWRWPF